MQWKAKFIFTMPTQQNRAQVIITLKLPPYNAVL